MSKYNESIDYLHYDDIINKINEISNMIKDDVLGHCHIQDDRKSKMTLKSTLLSLESIKTDLNIRRHKKQIGIDKNLKACYKRCMHFGLYGFMMMCNHPKAPDNGMIIRNSKCHTGFPDKCPLFT